MLKDDYRPVLRAEIAARLKAAIAKTGLSQNAVARLLKVSSGTVSGWTKGRTQPSLEEFAAMCHSLRMSPRDILGVEEPTKKTLRALSGAPGARAAMAKSALALARYDEAKKKARLNDAELRLGELAHQAVEALGALMDQIDPPKR